VVQRLCIIVACLGWIFIFLQSPNTGESAHAFLGIEQGRHYTKSVVSLKNLTMTTIIILGVVERLSAVGNMLVMERDWVIPIIIELIHLIYWIKDTGSDIGDSDIKARATYPECFTKTYWSDLQNPSAHLDFYCGSSGQTGEVDRNSCGMFQCSNNVPRIVHCKWGVAAVPQASWIAY